MTAAACSADIRQKMSQASSVCADRIAGPLPGFGGESGTLGKIERIGAGRSSNVLQSSAIHAAGIRRGQARATPKVALATGWETPKSRRRSVPDSRPGKPHAASESLIEHACGVARQSGRRAAFARRQTRVCERIPGESHIHPTPASHKADDNVAWHVQSFGGPMGCGRSPTRRRCKACTDARRRPGCQCNIATGGDSKA